MIRPDGTHSAIIRQVIETKSTRGVGPDTDPVREVVQSWDLEGTFLAEMDKEHCKPLIDYEAEVIKESISVGTVPHPEKQALSR